MSEHRDHEKLLTAEIERQRKIWRPGTPEHVLQRAAISVMMERGER